MNYIEPIAKVKQIETEVYSRVVGYFRPISQWNKAKQKEFHERKVFSKDHILEIVGKK